MSARIEKGYRLWGSDLTPEYTLAEGGVSWAMDKTKQFHGKAADFDKTSERLKS